MNSSLMDTGPVSTTSISTEMVQIINYEEEFNTSIGSFLDSQMISQLGFDYHVTSIMGPQSSGKSTLLNMLFGTQFRTMDESSGRYQVTQGVWMGRDSEKGILVMDLEGTDSRERGEDATTFERKSALFALALSEVLIVNVWAQDVGRYNAANMSLLKTVMELDLQLFFGENPSETVSNDIPKQRMHKTRLLFVLRDHVSSPFETLCGTLKADVDNIWNTISKPEAAVGTPVTDYFDLDFFALPHKVLMQDAFVKKGAELRRQFQEEEVFLDEYRRGVAADGFSAYAESVWETIRANRELDIPSQKEMLAHVRCEQIAKDAMAIVDEAFDPLKRKLTPSDGSNPEIVNNLLEQLIKASNSALESYQASAYRYSNTVADMKGMDLRARIGGDCKVLYDTQISLATDLALKQFRMALSCESDSKASYKPWENWGEVSKNALETALKEFKEASSKSLLIEQGGSFDENHPLHFAMATTKAAENRLSSTLEIELQRATQNVTTAARSYCVKLFDDSFKPPLLTVLENASADVWDRTTEVSGAAWEATALKVKEVYGDKGLGFNDEKLEESIEDDIKPMCFERAMTDIKDAVGTPANFLMRMTKRFDDQFRFDERGVPRHFGPTEDIEALFMAAREKGEELVELLGEVKLSGPLTRRRETARSIDEDVSRTVILEPHSRDDLREKLKRQAGAVFMEAKRAQEAAKITTKIPIWLFGLLVILGWNEIVMVLRNPLLLVLTIIIVPALYVGYSLDAPTMLLPAVKTTLMPIVNPLLVQAKDLLEQYTAQDPNVPAATTPPSSIVTPNQSASSMNVEPSTTSKDSVAGTDM